MIEGMIYFRIKLALFLVKLIKYCFSYYFKRIKLYLKHIKISVLNLDIDQSDKWSEIIIRCLEIQ